MAEQEHHARRGRAQKGRKKTGGKRWHDHRTGNGRKKRVPIQSGRETFGKGSRRKKKKKTRPASYQAVDQKQQVTIEEGEKAKREKMGKLDGRRKDER